MKERITRKICEGCIELVDGKGYATLSHEETVKLLFETLYERENELESIENIMKDYYALEDFLFKNDDKPLEVKSGMIWGALWVLNKSNKITSEEMKSIYGEFMSKQMKVR